MLNDPLLLDSSAIVKLVVDEPESSALTDYIRNQDSTLTASVISEVEVFRAVARVSNDLTNRVTALLSDFVMLPLTGSIRWRASSMSPTSLRTLDAIQLATAVELLPSLSCFVSYDERLNEASEAAGVAVCCPGG